MFSAIEMRGQSSLLHKSGTIEINTEYNTAKKPGWLIFLKLLGVAAMVAVGAAIGMPTLLELEFPLIQAVVITAGLMMVYCGIAFFFRPEPNTDNLGFGGGMANDPFQCSDNVNRLLWRAHCVLGPGRFTAETLLDTCVYLGIAKSESAVEAPESEPNATGDKMGPLSAAFDASRPIAALDPSRFSKSSGSFVAGQIQLDSQRFFAASAAPAANQAANG